MLLYALRALEYAEFNLTQITQSDFVWLMTEECQKRVEKTQSKQKIKPKHDWQITFLLSDKPIVP